MSGVQNFCTCPQAHYRKALSCAESMVWAQEEQPMGTAPGGPDSLAAFVQAPLEHFLRPVCRQNEAPPDVSVPRGDGRRRDSPALGNLSGLV